MLFEHLNQLSVAKEAGYSGWTKSDTPMAPQRDQDEETEMTLEVMEQLGRELDSEIEVSLLEFGYSSSSADDMRGKTSVTPLRAGAYESHVRYEQRKPNQSQYERPFKQNQFQKVIITTILQCMHNSEILRAIKLLPNAINNSSQATKMNISQNMLPTVT